MYITQGSTLPVPFNMLPAPKSARYAWNVIRQLVASDGNQLLEDFSSSKPSFINVQTFIFLTFYPLLSAGGQ